MAFSKIAASIRGVFAVLASLSLAMFAVPALANSSANADIAAPLRAAQAAKAAVGGTEDEEFRRLFNSWQSFEESSVPALAAVANAASRPGLVAGAPVAPIMRSTVSIPSRMPLMDASATSNFGMRTHPVLGGRRAHRGIDLAAPSGTPIYATADGIVSKASWYSSYGLFVSLEHGGKIETRYAHMSRLNVAAGQTVRKGDIIGFVGSTGRSTGPHLHYEVRIDGQAVNPIPYMNANS